MLKNIYMTTMNTQKIINLIKSKFNIVLMVATISSCSLSPGMHMQTTTTWLDDNETVYIDSINKEILIEDISNVVSTKLDYDYRIGKGDQITITFWGISEVFPMSNINSEQNQRRVDSNGNIFFPYVGVVKAEGLTQNELRIDIANKLSNFFKNPQLDLSISGFNSQRVYLLGEVIIPSKINITDIPLSLSEALGQTKGINNNTAEGSQVFIIRQAKGNNMPRIFIADLSSPSGFINAGNFYLSDNDIVYVNAKVTTRWNRVISQFFPFSTFLNSIDNLANSN